MFVCCLIYLKQKSEIYIKKFELSTFYSIYIVFVYGYLMTCNSRVC